MQWLPKEIKWQWIYLVFRWFMAAYFFGWLIPSGINVPNTSARYFIFLTNWCYLMWNCYLIISAISATVKVSLVYYRGERSGLTSTQACPKPYIDINKPVGCCGQSNDATSWYQKVQWVFFYLGAEMAVIVLILYWALIYNGGAVDGVNANTHLVNGIIALIDILFSGVPVRIFHFIYGIAFGATYVVFTGIYFAADGTNEHGDPYIYDVIDYGNNPGSATGWVLAVVLVLLPLVHLVLFGLYTVRFWLTYCLWARKEPQQGEQEMKEDDYSDDKV